MAIRFSPRGSSDPFTQVSLYLVNDRPIDFVEAHTDLEVAVDRSLKFHAHVRKSVAIVDGLTTNILRSNLHLYVRYIGDL